MILGLLGMVFMSAVGLAIIAILLVLFFVMGFDGWLKKGRKRDAELRAERKARKAAAKTAPDLLSAPPKDITLGTSSGPSFSASTGSGFVDNVIDVIGGWF